MKSIISLQSLGSSMPRNSGSLLTATSDSQTVEERREDIKINEYMEQSVSETFENEAAEKPKKTTYEEVTKILDQCEGYDETSIDDIKKKN